MNCPKCALQTLPDQKFCRSCGASLQMSTQPLTEYATVSDLERTPAITFKGEQQRTNRLTPWGFIKQERKKTKSRKPKKSMQRSANQRASHLEVA